MPGVERKEVKKIKLVVGDSDGLIALTNVDDSHHRKAIAINNKLQKEGAEIVFPNTVIAETITTLKRSKNLAKEAHLVNKNYQQGELIVLYIDERIQIRASQIFDGAKSKKNTFFDAVVAACAESLGADEIFSFDKWYSKLGFKLTQP
jgi:uncharacterized protein